MDEDDNEVVAATAEEAAADAIEEVVHMQSVTELLKGLRQPSQMWYDPDPEGWMLWSASVDEDDAASGFSTSVQVEWFPADGLTYCCDTHNNRVVSIQSDGRAYPYAGSRCGHQDGEQEDSLFASPSGVCVLPTGAVVVADTGNHCVRHIFCGWVTTMAGTPRTPGDKDGVGSYSELTSPCGVACDPDDGCVYVCDTGSSRIKQVTPEGVVSAFVGSGELGLADGVGMKASFRRPFAIVYWRGRLIVADTGNHALREIDIATATVRRRSLNRCSSKTA